MGGFNAIQLGMKYPHLFKGMVLSSPMIPLVDPYASFLKQIRIYATKRYRGCRIYAALLGVNYFVRYFFETKKEYDKFNPLNSQVLPPTLLIVGEKDMFGFYESCQGFLDNLGPEMKNLYLTHDGGHTVERVEDIVNWIKAI